MNNRHFSAALLLAAASSFLIPASLRAEPGVPDTSTTNATAVSAVAPEPAVTAPAAATTSSTVTPAATVPATPDAAMGSTYTVVSGDSLWKIAHENHCTVKSLMKLNNLKTKNLKPGQALKLPPAKTAKIKTTAKPAAKPTQAARAAKPLIRHKMYVKAQPVQDFDIPASTFASCPVPVATEEDTPVPAPPPVTPETPAPVAQLVSPADMPATAATDSETATSVTSPQVTDAAASTPAVQHSSEVAADDSSSAVVTEPTPVAAAPSPSSKPANHGFSFNPFGFFNKPAATDWGSRFLQEARALGDRGIEYDENWRPPGESQSWAMDCSNTSRYLYKVTTGIQLPRTASDQYFYLHLQNKAWDVPQAVNGYADCNYLRENLKPGDLLFWENTYRPERQPPITHVMVFLGNNDKGQWIMAGSQTSRGGEHNRRNGGPDVYVFDPTKACGGYTTWLGLVHHAGRFCAFGRPLEADPAKLSVAAND